jgi:hypothetical protein
VPDKIRAFIRRMNEKGIPAPMVTDGTTGKPSVTLTLVVVSAFYVQLALLNSFAAVFKGVDVTNALYWHGMALAAYLGRRVSGDGKKLEIDGDKEQK